MDALKFTVLFKIKSPAEVEPESKHIRRQIKIQNSKMKNSLRPTCVVVYLTDRLRSTPFAVLQKGNSPSTKLLLCHLSATTEASSCQDKEEPQAEMCCSDFNKLYND